MDIKYPIEIEYMKCVLQINEFSGPHPESGPDIGSDRSGGTTVQVHN